MPREVLQGTLDLMVLRTLAAMGPQHGLGLAKRILQVSEGLLDLNQGTLYPALLRLEQRRWITSRWGVSDNNRKAKFYELTARGRRQIREETEELGTDGGSNGQVSRQAGGRAVIWGRVIDVFRRRRLDTDLDSQLAYHLDALEAEARAQGLSPDDARAAARRAMGGLTQTQDAYRDQLRIPIVDAIRQDVRYGCRVLARNPGFSVVAVAILAIGITSATTIFSFVDAVLLKPLPYENGDRIVRILERRPDGATSWFSAPAFLDWRANNTVFEKMAAQQQGTRHAHQCSGHGGAPCRACHGGLLQSVRHQSGPRTNVCRGRGYAGQGARRRTEPRGLAHAVRRRRAASWARRFSSITSPTR